MRRGSGSVIWLLGDHLGSASVSYDGVNALHQGYKPWGETRFGEMGTPYQFTGQYRQASLGLDFFNARWYDPALGRFAQADTLIPEASQGVQAWDRYAFVNNNPIIYTDPNGHFLFASALIGAVLSAGVNYGMQAYNNYSSGMSVSEAINPSNIDMGSVVASGVGGAIAGLTMGAASGLVAAAGFTSTTAGAATAFVIQNVAGAAIANILGGQAEALTNGIAENITIDSAGISIGDADDIIDDAKFYGFMDAEIAKFDGLIGGAVGILGGLSRGAIADAATPTPLFLGSAKYRGTMPTYLVRPATILIDGYIEDLTQSSGEYQPR
jgi:RHS repeat-associated protein